MIKLIQVDSDIKNPSVMNNEQILLDKWHELSETDQKQVLAFIDSLGSLNNQSNQSNQYIWEYLEPRPQSSTKQLYITGKKLKAATVWRDMIVNDLTPQEVAENKEIPLSAVYEAIKYCEIHQELLKEEAQIERDQLEEKGIQIEPKIT